MAKFLIFTVSWAVIPLLAPMNVKFGRWEQILQSAPREIFKFIGATLVGRKTHC